MKIFLSWSGETSHRVACVLREWLPSVIQAIRPYVSSEDIDKGARWSTDIATELEQAGYGIICITRENVEAPWIHFEAGALSKSIDKAKVTPFLFRMKRSEVQGPLLQFQSVVNEKDDLLKLMRSLNNSIEEGERLTEEHLQKTFDVWWPQLSREFDQITEKHFARKAHGEGKDEGEILEEILELVRNQQRLLTSPQAILPPEYLSYVISRERTDSPRRKRSNERLHTDIVEILEKLKNIPDSDPTKLILIEMAGRIHSLYHDLSEPLVIDRGRRQTEAELRAVQRVLGKGEVEK